MEWWMWILSIIGAGVVLYFLFAFAVLGFVATIFKGMFK